jgi:hypothetical protein
MKFSDYKVAELNQQIKTSINEMANAGEVPAGRDREPGLRVPDETIRLEDGRPATVRFHKARNVYQLAVANENGSTVIKEAANLTELTYDLLHDQAQDTLQRQDVEIENARIDKGLLADFDEVDDKTSETADWLQNYHYGQIYRETIKPLSYEEEQKMYSMTMGMLGKLRLPLTAPNLDLAFRELWDTNDEYAGYIDKARAEKRRLAVEAAAAAQAQEDQAAKIYPDKQPATPYAPPFTPMRNAGNTENTGTKRFGVDAELTTRQQSFARRKGISVSNFEESQIMEEGQ